MTFFLKHAVLQANQPKFSILQVLDKRIGGFRKHRGYDVIHASDTTKPDFCPRHVAFLDLLKEKPKDEFINTALKATFDIGSLTAKQLVEEWSGPHAIGNWKCRRCGHSVTMMPKPAPGCAKHKDCIWEYQEVRFESKEYGIEGGIDVLFDVGAPKLMITELKIMKGEDWQALIAPLPEHRIRTSLYCKLVADSDSPYIPRINLHEARVLYVSREYGKKSDVTGTILPFKEFVVTRDDAMAAIPLRRAKQVKVFREQGLMPAFLCSTPLDKYAKKCSTCKICFSGEHPAQQPPLTL